MDFRTARLFALILRNGNTAIGLLVTGRCQEDSVTAARKDWVGCVRGTGKATMNERSKVRRARESASHRTGQTGASTKQTDGRMGKSRSCHRRTV